MKIMNFGSLNIDNVYTMEHFVRPGETVSSVALQKFAGGKGLNQSIALARADAEVHHAGAIGEDGSFLVALLQEIGVDTSFVQTLGEQTGHAVIQVDSSGQNCIILYGGANRCITEEHVESALEHFGSNDLLLLQNEINRNALIMEQAFAKGMQIALNPSPIDDGVLSLPLDKVSWFLLNEIEGTELTGKTDPLDILSEMKRRFPSSKVVLTLGKQGVIAWDGKETFRHGIYKVPVVDTTAAGDTFTGFFLSCVSKGMGTKQCLELASKASSLAIGMKGAANSIPDFRTVAESHMELQS